MFKIQFWFVYFALFESYEICKTHIIYQTVAQAYVYLMISKYSSPQLAHESKLCNAYQTELVAAVDS